MESTESSGLRLLKKGQKGIVHLIFSRVGVMMLMILLQVVVLFALFRWFAGFLPHIFGGTMLFSVFMAIYLLNTPIDPTAKLTWLFIIMLMPVFGTLLFIYTQSDIGHRAVHGRIQEVLKETEKELGQDEATMSELEGESPDEAALARYVQRCGCFPVYKDNDVTYFPLGEDKFAALIPELKKAKSYIFLEYFIVEEGVMWGEVLEILAEKVKEGVEVRMMYDGTNEFSTLPYNYPEKLRELGIQCKMFSPLTPFLSTYYNYRDHRKILVIDGHTAFTGGINLADEYINRYEKYGHWKDTAIMVKGEAARSFTLMFLQMWNITEKNVTSADYARYLNAPIPPIKAEGFVLPYADCPLDADKVGERVYMDILNHATRYVHIMSPYLILDGEMETAIKFAAEKGIDVRLILPGIPDKKAAYSLAKTHYRSLLASGVKIYEYTPGFVHAKVFVSDDVKAVVGTINLDYRSLYHHFECAAYLYRTSCIGAIEEDFQKTQSKCRVVTEETIKNEKLKVKVTGFVMKTVAPLL